MRKLLICLFAGIFAIAAVFAKVVFIDYEIVDTAEEAGIEFCFDGVKAEKIAVPDEKDQEAIVVQDDYKVWFDGCEGEVCYSYFKAGPAPKNAREYGSAVYAFMYANVNNIAGESKYLKQFNQFKLKDFNGDYLLDQLYECKGNPLGKDYKYLRIIAIDKRDTGCVFMSYFCNDLKFFAREDNYYYWADPSREFNAKGLTAKFKE